MNQTCGSFVSLFDVAEVERARSGKDYPAGCVLIQLSATKGQVLYHAGGEVASKYAVVTTNSEFLGMFVYEYINMIMPQFCCKYQTGINIQVEQLKHLRIPVIPIEQQRGCVKMLEAVTRLIDLEQMHIDNAKGLKTYLLENMLT